jgi:hypothetical protein
MDNSSITHHRLNTLKALGPRFCHITSDDTDGFYVGELQLAEGIPHAPTIKNCKPGIWASVYRHARKLPNPNSDARDAIVYWIEDGHIDLEKPIDDWKLYVQAWHDMLGKETFRHFDWKREATFSVDGGLANILAFGYLNETAAAKIMKITNTDQRRDFEDLIIVYLGALARGGSWFETFDKEKEGYTIGGMSCELALSMNTVDKS